MVQPTRLRAVSSHDSRTTTIAPPPRGKDASVPRAAPSPWWSAVRASRMRCAQPPVLTRTEDRVVIERIGDRNESAMDRGGARCRKLLAHDDLGEPGKATLAAAQRRHSGEREDRCEAGIERNQRRDAMLQVSF